jgi:creatinine amidohydrolase
MRWEELTAPDIEAMDRDRTVVVLPLGSVEQHGRHMPLGTDSILAHAVALKAADLGAAGRSLVLPPPWYGFSEHHMRFAGTVTLSVKTLMRLAEDIVGSVVAHGFRRVVMVNGHGGNNGAIDVLASVLGARHYGAARIASLTYFQLARDAIAALRQSAPGGMGHACEFETAMMLHLRPDLVKMERAAVAYPDPGSAYLSTDLLGAPRVRTYLDFKDLSETGTFGDPSLATAEKGARFFAAVTEELARFIDDFSRWPVAEKAR